MTSHVCFGCAKLIANSGLSRVVVRADAAAPHRHPTLSYRFLYRCGLNLLVREADVVWRADSLPDGSRSWFHGRGTEVFDVG